MKPSGIEWIGDIPDDWEVTKISRLYSIQLGKMLQPEKKSSGDTYEPYICAANLSSGTFRLDEVKYMWISEAEKDIYRLKCDDLLVTEGGDVGISSIWKDDISPCYFQNALHRVVPKKGNSNRFLHYWLIVLKSVGYIDLICNKSTIAHFTKEKFAQSLILSTPLRTQQRIADYLDEKCGEIDATIAKQKESIEKLKAYKQSLISETVTKGLDKSAPLKPSGIEWIGDIPAHWEVCKIKNHCNLKTGSTPSSKDLSMFDGAENWFTPSDFTENYMLKNSLRRLNAKVFDQNLVPIFPPLSVLIVGIGATTGKVGFTTSKSSSNQQITAIIPKDKNIFPKFLLFWMIANTKMIRETALFTTLPILNNDTLGNATLLIPPYKEQLELASYIENKNIEIDVIINKKQNIIQKLDAYKKSLIFECVTGKTDL